MIPKKMSLRKGDFIEVRWIDSYTPGHSNWMTDEELQDHEQLDLIIQSVGLYKGRDKKYIKLYASRGLSSGEDMNYLNPISIPKGCIDTIYKLKRSKLEFKKD